METQVTLSIVHVFVAAGAFVVGWLLGQYWKAHKLGAMTMQERLLEIATNSRAASKVEELSPQLKAFINEAVAKAIAPK